MAEDRSIWVTALSTYSATREKSLEHRFISEVTSELWRRAIFDFAVSHSEVDNSGYDVIIEATGIARHIQLKAMQLDGKRRDFNLQMRLADKPLGCAVLMLHDPVTLAITGFRFLAGLPGAKLPPLGDKLARKTKGNAQGYKAAKPAFRAVPIAAFAPVDGMPMLVDRLFGRNY